MQKVEIYVKSNTESPDLPFATVGNAVWSDKNFDGTTFRNGDSIPEYVGSDAGWDALTTPAWCYVDNDSANGDVYGKLYNFYAVSDPRGIAPKGWRVSTLDDWNSLASFASESIAALKTKSASLWDTAGDDSYGLAILPSAYRGPGGGFGNLDGTDGYYWTSTSHDSSDANAVSYDEGYDDIFFTTFSNSEGGAIRLVRNEGHTKLDLYDDEVIELTENIKDFKDISKVLTDHTQQFSVPASTINNKVFKHYYNQDVVSGFDARFRVDAIIKLNGIDWKEGQIRLTSVDMKNGVADSYNITFFGNTVSLKTLLSEDKLDVLEDLDAFNHSLSFVNTKKYSEAGANLVYDVDGVPTGITDTVSDDIPDMIYPFISYDSRYYIDTADNQPDIDKTRNLYTSGSSYDDYHGLLWTDLKPAILVMNIVESISRKYNIEFSDDFLNRETSCLRRTYMAMSSDSGSIEGKVSVSSVTNSISEFSLDSGDEVRSGPGLGYLKTYKAGGNSGRFNYVYYNLTGTITPIGSGAFTLKIFNKESEKVYLESSSNTGALDFDLDISNNTTFGVGYVDNQVSFEVSTVGGISDYSVSNLVITQTDALAYPTEINIGNYSISSQSISEGIGFRKNFVPKIKCIDFLKSLIKMFNLVIYKENDVFVVETSDSFYKKGGNHDITQYVDSESFKIARTDIYSEISYEYKEPKSVLAVKSNQLTGDSYGSEKFSSDETTSFDGGEYKVGLNFSHMLFEGLVDLEAVRVGSPNPYTSYTWGYSVNESFSSINEQALVFTSDKEYSGGFIKFDDGSSYVGIEEIYRPRNEYQDFKKGGRTSSLNFGSELGYAPRGTSSGPPFQVDFSLFSEFHVNNILNTYNSQSRMLSTSAYLKHKDILNIKLNDNIIINDNIYIINKKTLNLQSGLAKMELITDNYTSFLLNENELYYTENGVTKILKSYEQLSISTSQAGACASESQPVISIMIDEDGYTYYYNVKSNILSANTSISTFFYKLKGYTHDIIEVSPSGLIVSKTNCP